MFSDPSPGPAPGFDPAALQAAVDFALAHETPWPRDLRAHIEAGYFEAPPDNAILGRTAPRGAPNGLVLRQGRLAARWGDTWQVDMTFSVAKSYLAMLAGLAVGDGLIPDLDAPVRRLVDDGGFEGAQNAGITWRHLLQNTSEWEGELFGKSDLIDRGRNLVVEGRGQKGLPRPLQPPGAYWEYNDVRVNRLSLALLRVFGRPLPEVFAERIMRPIGASDDWRWEGYETSWVEIGGRLVQSVSGGGHWGGGVFIHAEDQARIGQLCLQDGVWEGRRLLPEGWVAACRTPCALNPHYGLLWWLNTGRTRWPAASEGSFCFSGAGGNITWVDPESGVVAVLRWVDPTQLNGFMERVGQALR
ncbi:beta-lactamase family protein [Siccirubricoccus sp. KC 17139]|uniref:Beta-lactamase family protein n=1 Tax=Siccirubricoccus soli TaxID=2899147 RepID=A0ABT1D727_9PROT|nr:serine hydrolase [Siccirubricoccus soli]MCO6417726.1 beta-lactamase family protein [Siccirubricoccus soli]MCP2683861.1 beta-lactamase family protein [Siccirubricoccus soli]